ncbi:MAG: 4Fe-4S binding protein [Proteobacteria bacterium]|nr:4Fe-4S binding protein [Pseudomonadota bacterium]
MSVLINFKMCSNGWQCNCPEVCPTGAFYYDKDEKTLKIDNAKCISCGLCAKACPIAAVCVAKSQAEYEKIQAEIDADPRRMEDLFVEKLGADPIAVPYTPDQAEKLVSEQELVCLELKQDESKWACQLKSNSIMHIIDMRKIKYASVVDTESLAKKYNVSDFPALVFFKDGVQIGKIEGYFENSESEQALLKNRIKKIIG